MSRVGLKYQVKGGKKIVDYSYIVKQLSRKSRIEVFDIMSEAIDLMEQSNTRSKWQCIAMAMGYKIEYKGNTEEMIYTKLIA